MQEPLAPLTVAVVEGTPNVVRLFGELDLATVPILRAELRTLTGDVELHCDQLTFVDSSGLSLFVDVHQAVPPQRRRLRAPRRPSRRAPHHPGQRPRRHLRHPQLARLAAFSRGSPPQLQGSKPTFRQGWRHAGDHLHRGARSDPRRRRGRHAMCRCGDGDAPGPYGPRRRRGRPGDVPERHAVDARDRTQWCRPARPLGSARPGRRERGASHPAGDLPPSRHGDDQDGQGRRRRRLPHRPPASRARRDPARRRGRGRCGCRVPASPSPTSSATRPAVSPAWSAATPTGGTRRSRAASSSAPTGCIPGSPDRSARPSSTNATGHGAIHVRVLRRSRLVGYRVPPRRAASSRAPSPPTAARPTSGSAGARTRSVLSVEETRATASSSSSSGVPLPRSPDDSVAGAEPRRCGASPGCRTSCDNQSDAVGRWSATPGTSATPSPASASATPSATRTTWPPGSTARCATISTNTPRSPATTPAATATSPSSSRSRARWRTTRPSRSSSSSRSG